MNKKNKQWTYKDFYTAIHNLEAGLSVAQVAEQMGRTHSAIGVLPWIVNKYEKGQMQYVSKNMRAFIKIYLDSKLDESPAQVVEERVAQNNPFQVLDNQIETLKHTIAEVIGSEIEAKMQYAKAAFEKTQTENEQMRERIFDLEKENSDLREFKNSVRTTSVWQQLSKRLNNIV